MVTNIISIQFTGNEIFKGISKLMYFLKSAFNNDGTIINTIIKCSII